MESGKEMPLVGTTLAILAAFDQLRYRIDLLWARSPLSRNNDSSDTSQLS